MDLAEAVLERQRLDTQHLHLLHLLLVEELHLIHRDDAVAVKVHAPEPVLHAGTTTSRINWTGLSSVLRPSQHRNI